MQAMWISSIKISKILLDLTKRQYKRNSINLMQILTITIVIVNE